MRRTVFFWVAFWMLVTPLKAQTDDPPISGGCYVISHQPSPFSSFSPYLEYSRRGMIVWEVTPASAIDFDITPCGWEENPVVIIGWTDFGAGGEFGYSPDGYSFYPVDNPELVNAYRPKPDFVGILRIAPILDDIPIGVYSGMPTYDDPPVIGGDWKMTIWEFEITSPCPKDWRPQPYDILSFTVRFRPTIDHNGNSMARYITFFIESSNEPSFCLNACCEGYEECKKLVVNEYGESVYQCPLFPYCAYDEGLLWGAPGCIWHQQLMANGEIWRAMTIWDSDLKFMPNQQGIIICYEEPGYAIAGTMEPTTDATVQVVCLDYGAYGTLSVAYECDTERIWARLPLGVVDDDFSDPEFGDYTVQIPYDRKIDGIADCWQSKYGDYANEANEDSDDTPTGDAERTGDGLSAYEEYRGMVVRGVWKEFDPKIKDMFVMNFGAGYYDPINDRWVEAVIPNDAIESENGFPGAGMPLLWLLNANEGETVSQARQYRDAQGNIHNILLTGKRVNYLHGYAHLRDVYSAVVVPGTQLLGENSPAETFGPIWDVDGLPVIEINASAVEASVNG